MSASTGSANAPFEVCDDGEQAPLGHDTRRPAPTQEHDEGNLEFEQRADEIRTRKWEKAWSRRLRKQREREEQRCIEQERIEQEVAEHDETEQERSQEDMEEDMVDEEDLEDKDDEGDGVVHLDRRPKITHPPSPDIPAAYRTGLPPRMDQDRKEEERAGRRLMEQQRLEQDEETEQEMKEQERRKQEDTAQERLQKERIEQEDAEWRAQKEARKKLKEQRRLRKHQTEVSRVSEELRR
jgi:hypothetical protein